MPFIHNDQPIAPSDVPVAFIRSGFTPRCDDCLDEARERMTAGGIPVISLSGGYVVQIGGRVPQWVARAAR